MFTQEPLPVPADALVSPDLDDKVAGYLAPLRDLTLRGVASVRFPVDLRALEAVPELIDMLGDPGLGLAAYDLRVGADSDRAKDALDGLRGAGLAGIHGLLVPAFLALRNATEDERPQLLRDLSDRLEKEVPSRLAVWDWPRFAEGAIGRLCRSVKISPLEPEAYRRTIDLLADRWGNDPHADIVAALAADRSVPAALARMYLRLLNLHTQADSGTEIVSGAAPARPARLGRLLGGGEASVEQRRRIVTDAGVLHLSARYGARLEVAVEMETSGRKRATLLKLSRKAGPDLLAGIESDLRRALGRAAA